MATPLYNSPEWRELPRDGDCVVEFLFGAAAGPCSGVMHRHHVIPGDPGSRSVQVCASHHPRLEAALKRLLTPVEDEITCPHGPGVHVYPGAREACEANLRRAARRRRRELQPA